MKRYGFNLSHEHSKKVIVFEAAIDLMSYVDITKDYESNMIALGMLADAPLATFLEEHPQITTIRFCLDNDEPGKKATEKLLIKYYELGFEVENFLPPTGYKDINEWLIATKLLNLGVATQSIAKIKWWLQKVQPEKKIGYKKCSHIDGNIRITGCYD